jgi:sensor histidine kinase YesM
MRWVIPLGICTAAVIAFSISGQIYVQMLAHRHSFARLFFWQFSRWLFWAAVAPVVLRHGATLAQGAKPRSRMAVVVPLAIALIAAHLVLSSLLTYWLQPYVPIERYTLAVSFGLAMQNQLIVDVLVYTMLLILGYAAAVYDRARLAELRESRLEADLARAQLNALRLEIEPHFLFNTLNAIASLIRSQSGERALEMLLGLSELMRSTLDHDVEQTRTVDAELAFVRRYVELQRVRFVDRLQVSYDIAADVGPQLVPTLLVQPLVENAFRHGIARQPGSCHLEITARVDEGRLHLRVRDDGAGLPEHFSIGTRGGVGLRNAESRLRRLYGDQASLHVGPAAPRGTEVHLVIPARLAPAPRLQAVV